MSFWKYVEFTRNERGVRRVVETTMPDDGEEVIIHQKDLNVYLSAVGTPSHEMVRILFPAHSSFGGWTDIDKWCYKKDLENIK